MKPPRRSKFLRATLRSTGQKVKVLPRINNHTLQPPEYERILMPGNHTKGLEVVLVLRSGLKFDSNDLPPTPPPTGGTHPTVLAESA